MFKIPGLDTYFDGEKSQGCDSEPDIIGFRLADGMSVGVGGLLVEGVNMAAQLLDE